MTAALSLELPQTEYLSTADHLLIVGQEGYWCALWALWLVLWQPLSSNERNALTQAWTSDSASLFTPGPQIIHRASKEINPSSCATLSTAGGEGRQEINAHLGKLSNQWCRASPTCCKWHLQLSSLLIPWRAVVKLESGAPAQLSESVVRPRVWGPVASQALRPHTCGSACFPRDVRPMDGWIAALPRAFKTSI